MDPAIHDRQVHFVVLLVQPAGGNQIVPVEGFGHLGERQAESRQTERVHDHLILGCLSADQFHPRYARNAEKFWLQIVTGQFPQRRSVPPGRGQADADDGKGREVHPINFSLSGGGKGMPDLSEAAENVQLRLPHVHLPREEKIYLRGATTSRRADSLAAEDVFHRLLYGTGDRGHHFVSRHHAVVRHDDYARKVSLGKDRRAHLPCRIPAAEAESQHQKDNRNGVPNREPSDS